MRDIKNRTTIIALAIIFAVAASGLSYATTLKCTVDTVKDGIVTLHCGKNADKIHTGDKVKVRPVSQKKSNRRLLNSNTLILKFA